MLSFYPSSRSLITCLNVKHFQVASSHRLTPHCYLYNFGQHLLPFTKIQHKELAANECQRVYTLQDSYLERTATTPLENTRADYGRFWASGFFFNTYLFISFALAKQRGSLCIYFEEQEKTGYHETSACHSRLAMNYHHIFKPCLQPCICTLTK